MATKKATDVGAVTVLWVSRHEPLPAQFKVLEDRLGRINVVKHVGRVANAEEVAELAKRVGARYVIPVLPLSIIARLVELAPRYGFEVLWSRMELIASTADPREAERLVREAPDRRAVVEYADGIKRVYEFRGIERIKEVKLVTEPL